VSYAVQSDISATTGLLVQLLQSRLGVPNPQRLIQDCPSYHRSNSIKIKG